MTPRARLVVPGLLGLALALAAFAVARPAAAIASPPCNERTTYSECRPTTEGNDECQGNPGSGLCPCTWDSVSAYTVPADRDHPTPYDPCDGKNGEEGSDIIDGVDVCKVWDPDKYPDPPFCTPTPCEQASTLSDCVGWCSVYYDANGDPCDPTMGCAWVDVSQDACDCQWDHPTVAVDEGRDGTVLHCDTFLDEMRNPQWCGSEESAEVNYCTTNLAFHCEPQPRCDVDANGQIDSVDVSAIYARLGQAATDECDPADATQSGDITVVDASQCTEQCTYADCATSPPSGGGCGIGPELALLVPLLAGLRGRARGRPAA